MVVFMDNKLAQLLLNACYMHSGALVHVVTDVINSNAAEKPNWNYNWQLDFNSCFLHLKQGLMLKSYRVVVNLCRAQPVMY